MSSHMPPSPDWVCRRCGWTNDGFQNLCVQCTSPRVITTQLIQLPTTSPRIQPVEEEYSSSFRKKKILGIAGIALLVIGVFMPIVSVPIMGSLNYLYNGRGDGVMVLVLALISALLIWRERFKGLVFTGLLSLAVMSFTLCHFLATMNAAQAEMAKSDNIFKGLGQVILSTVQLQWGWLPLLAGAFALVASGVLREEFLDRSGQPLPQSQTQAFMLLSASVLSVGGLLLAASWFPPTFLRSFAVPSLKNESNGTSQFLNFSATPEPTASEPKGWQVSEETAEMDGKKTVTLSLKAETKIPGIIGDVTPRLIIRCRKGEADVFINTESMAEIDFWSNTSKVRVKFDDGPPIPQRWSSSTDHQALFAPKVPTLVKQLTQTKVLLFEFSPYNKTAQEIRFDVTGLDAQISMLVSACPKLSLAKS